MWGVGERGGGGDGGWWWWGVRLASVTPTIRSDHTDVRSKREDPPSSPRCKLIRGGGGANHNL